MTAESIMPHRYPRHFNDQGAARFEGAISDLDGGMGKALEAALVSSRASRHDRAPMRLSGTGSKPNRSPKSCELPADSPSSGGAVRLGTLRRA